MNTVKKIIAFAVVIFISFRLLMISASASFAAPIIAEETLKTALIEGMLAGGTDYTKDDLEAWDLDELENEFKIQMTTNQNFKPKEAAPKIFPFIPFSDTVIGEFLASMEKNGSDLYDFINPTYSGGVDMQGGTCVYYDYDSKDPRYYTVYYSSQPGHLYYNNSDELRLYINFDYREFHSPNGVTRQDYSSTLSTTASEGTYYGKWILDGEEVNVGGEEIPVIGEADGTQVTVDMLNPDGTVTIDGTTYYPKDYIDWDKFKDEAIIDLLNDILAKIDSVPVAETDTTKDLVDSITDSVSIPDELSDYIMPSGISSVFPFCLPFDLYRGFKLLSAPSVAPVLKIPFEVPEFGYFKGYKTVLTIDFEKYDKYFSVFRWGTYFIFVISLIFISTKIVKGAGA